MNNLQGAKNLFFGLRYTYLCINIHIFRRLKNGDNLAVGAVGLKNPYDKDFAWALTAAVWGYEHGLVGNLSRLCGG